MSQETSVVELRACSTCKYSVIQRGPPPEIFTVRVCKRFPPQVLVMPGPGGQVGISGTFPMVTDDLWCHEYAPEGAANG